MTDAAASEDENESPSPLLLLQDEDDSNADRSQCLPLSLSLLYGLNGVTLSLPTTALLYIVNTRAALPVSFLSVYGALAFLPFSLKPLYAYVTEYLVRKAHLLEGLLLGGGVAVGLTAWVPANGIFWCFVAAVGRGITSAWAEFLLGICLIRHAAQSGSPQEAASKFQAQAATCRNVGSFLANLVAFFVFAHAHYSSSSSEEELTDATVTLLLVGTAVLQACGAMIAYKYPVDSPHEEEPVNHPSLPQLPPKEHDDDDDMLRHPGGSNASAESTLFQRRDVQALVVFQLAMILLALKSPLVHLASEWVWGSALGLLIVMLIVSLSKVEWKRAHQVGVFLILRNAVPKSTYLMESYVYVLWQSTPMLLQFLSLVSMGIMTLASYCYGRCLSRWSHGNRWVGVMVVTTVVSSLVSLSYLALIGLQDTSTKSVAVVLVVNSVTTFFAEWKFLPDVILATTTTVDQLSGSRNALETQYQPTAQSDECPEEDFVANEENCPRDIAGIQYGSLISCIDFGGQIGAWVTVPLVAALGVSRDNGWAHLDTLIVMTSLLGLASIGLVPILLKEQ